MLTSSRYVKQPEHSIPVNIFDVSDNKRSCQRCYWYYERDLNWRLKKNIATVFDDILKENIENNQMMLSHGAWIMNGKEYNSVLFSFPHCSPCDSPNFILSRYSVSSCVWAVCVSLFTNLGWSSHRPTITRSITYIFLCLSIRLVSPLFTSLCLFRWSSFTLSVTIQY